MAPYTFFTNYGVFVLLCSQAYTVTSQGTPAESCVKQTGACSCTTATGHIDLSPLDQAKVDGTPKYVIYVYDALLFVYLWRDVCMRA